MAIPLFLSANLKLLAASAYSTAEAALNRHKRFRDECPFWGHSRRGPTADNRSQIRYAPES